MQFQIGDRVKWDSLNGQVFGRIVFLIDPSFGVIVKTENGEPEYIERFRLQKLEIFPE